MKISEKNENRLSIIQPDNAHRAQAFIFTGIGLIGTIAVILSGEGLVNGIILYLLLAMGILWFRVGGKPDSLMIDKLQDLVEMTEQKGAFSKPEIRTFKLSSVKSCDLDGSHFGGAAYEVTNRKGYAIILQFNEGDKITATPYTNGRKKCEAVFIELQSFLNIN
jgi:hypothetical protein